MEYRYEYKYLVSSSLLPVLRKMIAPYIELDTHVEHKETHQYSVRSIYFDTPNFDYYFDKLEGVKSVTLKTVNGKAEVELPANADADISAHTLNGGIKTSTGLTVKKNWPVGKDLQGKLGKGGTKVRLETVNGGIQVRQLDPVKAVLAEQPEK